MRVVESAGDKSHRHEMGVASRSRRLLLLAGCACHWPACSSAPIFAETTNESSLPPFLAAHRLVDTVPLGSPRFTPVGSDELMHAIFASWNLLDALMYSLEPSATFQTGYLRELQVRRMVQLAKRPGTRHYCEVGMNGGHSLVAVLLANADVTAHVFDLFKWQYSWPAAKLLNASFGGRLHFHPGWSHQTLPPFTAHARAEGITCDLMLVDGGHTFRAARSDIHELQAVASSRTLLVTDDIGMPPGYAIKVLNRTGTLRIEELYGPYPRRTKHNPCMRTRTGTSLVMAKSGRMCPSWGFAVSSYQHPGSLSKVRGGKGGGSVLND